MAQWQTGFSRPDDASARDLVAEALRGAGPAVNPSSWQWVEHGSANLVVLAGQVAVRVSRTAHAAGEAIRVQHLVDALPRLPFAVPSSLGTPVTAEGLVAHAQQRLTGDAHPAGSGDPAQLKALLEAIHGVELPPVRDVLAPARSFMGGDNWYEVMIDHAIPLLDASAQARARRIVDRLANLDPVAPVLNHGDLAGSNVLWANGRVTGVLDWDLAAADDGAEDAAALGAWHGWAVIADAVPADVLRRAAAIRDSFPLQLVCHAIVTERDPHELRRAIAGANRRLLGT